MEQQAYSKKAMEYVIAKNSSTGIDNRWFERNIPTFELARQKAVTYPDARYIIEYRSDLQSKGMLPTGRCWKIREENQ